MQLTFFPKIDRKATQVRLEEILENVRIYRQLGMIRNEMKVTASSEVRYHGPTNIIGKPTEDVALTNIAMSEREVKLQHLSFQIDKALSRFSKNQRDIIVKRYLEDEEVFDYMVYNEIGMSKRTYRRNKSNAFYKLAFALRLEGFCCKVQKKYTSAYKIRLSFK
ncbi:ArpU family transcriptional regulator [Bacillus mycoides]|nr:ArpU family transcriptional regulator [Bacillus mycoides]SCM90572.1 ArpU family phage transcriptional regulator [Bacillus mycoides]